eukprot:gene8628-11061_t
MLPACFALLDDSTDHPATAPRSRLYTGYQRSLRGTDASTLPALLTQMQAALQQGLHAVALLSYELGAELLQIDAVATTDLSAAAEILLFSQCQHLSAADTAIWLQQQADDAEATAGIANVRTNVDEAAFCTAIDRIHDYIAAGDTYQVNYTYRLHFDAYGAPLQLYRQLRARQPVPYGALISLPDGHCILSFSPELFVRHQDGRLLAQPMKGTAPAAGDDTTENGRRAEQLTQDEKNRAENLMIVDLMRHDLSKVAEIGSVKVTKLNALESYPNVHHLVSTVTGQLQPGKTAADVLCATLSPGSISGAPKVQAMKVISEMEAARGPYCGSLFAIDAGGAMESSVLIRTLALERDEEKRWQYRVCAGGGIVADSQPEAER